MTSIKFIELMISCKLIFIFDKIYAYSSFNDQQEMHKTLYFPRFSKRETVIKLNILTFHILILDLE